MSPRTLALAALLLALGTVGAFVALLSLHPREVLRAVRAL